MLLTLSFFPPIFLVPPPYLFFVALDDIVDDSCYKGSIELNSAGQLLVLLRKHPFLITAGGTPRLTV